MGLGKPRRPEVHWALLLVGDGGRFSSITNHQTHPACPLQQEALDPWIYHEGGERIGTWELMISQEDRHRAEGQTSFGEGLPGMCSCVQRSPVKYINAQIIKEACSDSSVCVPQVCLCVSPK